MQPRFAHFSLRPADVDRSAAFYVDVLGFVDGERPPFKFYGKWLYLDGAPVLHLIGDRQATVTSDDFLDRKALDSHRRGSGAVDHIAMSLPAAEIDVVRERLNAKGIVFAERIVPLLGFTQLFVEDPDGVTIELLFDR